jgi:hypothetical protein
MKPCERYDCRNVHVLYTVAQALHQTLNYELSGEYYSAETLITLFVYRIPKQMEYPSPTVTLLSLVH